MDHDSIIFTSRSEAGHLLAGRLRSYTNQADVIVLGLPRGGVPVAYELAAALHVPMDIFLCRKLGAPGREELAMGAIASGGVRVLHQDVMDAIGVSARELDEITERESRELDRREKVYRGDTPPPNLSRRTVVLVDDGIATGSSMEAAILALRAQQPARIVVAVPVAPPSTVVSLRPLADELVCLAEPKSFRGVGEFYKDFRQLTDDEVRVLLRRPRPGSDSAPCSRVQ